jgi:polyisoprenyl-teichoic acid--peptidoglycan teichoic acid transferase
LKIRPRRRSRPVLTLVILLGAILVGGASLFSYLFYFRPVAQAVGLATGQLVPRPIVQGSLPGIPAAAAQAPAPTPPPLSGNEPINILLLGSDTDAKFEGTYNTQIMIVVSIVPAQKKVSMLSIPRDLWVQIPGHNVEKVGLAYGAGGVALARQTVETDFGISIHYSAWVGLDGFIKVIDTLGGVDVDVSHPIVDDAYPDDVNSPDPYAYRRLYIPAGLQHLDGVRALEYVRSRHGDLIGDFGRSQRQQQVLDALRSKTNGRDLLTRLPELASDLKDSVRTDMSLQDLAKFAAFADQIRSDPVKQYTLLPPTYSNNGTSADGQSIVVPDWRQIRPLVDSIFLLKTATTLPMTVPSLGVPPATPTAIASPTKLAASASASASASGTPHIGLTPTPTRDLRPRTTVRPGTPSAVSTRPAVLPSPTARAAGR